MLRVISLGWGVQSWTLAAMSALGELESVDFAIHSDTTWERQPTYEFARIWTPWLEERGVRVVTVSDAEQAAKATTSATDMPAFAERQKNEQGAILVPAFSKSKKGQLRRQCTGRWKVHPQRQYIAQELARRGSTKQPGIVEQWLGISKDEWQRAKDADVKYITHRYPLLELNMTRADCLEWLSKHSLPSPGKSACVMCPYHSRKAWQEIKRTGGSDWETAVRVDEAIRNTRPPYPLYVHPSLKPLAEAVVIPEDFGATQLELLASDDADAECDSGYCFL